MTKPRIINGNKKWNPKNLLSVALDTQNPPTNIMIKLGRIENRFVITVPPQKLICPQAKTYPRNAVAIKNINIISPDNHRLVLYI